MVYIIIIIFSLCSCVTNSNSPTCYDLVEFDIPEVIKQDVETVLLSKHANSCSYISLELTKKSTIRYIRNVYLTDREIITIDWHSCLLFDKQSGKFIRKIGTSGKGPGEYLNIISSTFDEKNGIIYILSSGNHAIIGYNLNGDVVHYIPRHDKSLLYIGLLDSTTYIGTIPNNRGDEKTRLLLGNFLDKSVSIIPNYSFFPRKRSKTRGSTTVATASYYNFGTQLYQFNGQLYLKEAWNDTVFQIQKFPKIIPQYVFNLDKLKIPDYVRGDPESIESLLETQCVGQIYPLETDDYLFFKFEYKNIHHACIYDKKKMIAIVVDKQKNRFIGMKNDLEGNIPFWPEYVNNNGEMLKWINADEFCQYQKRNGIDILPDLQEEDNPVIMIVN